jgi:6-phosphogluconolactonase
MSTMAQFPRVHALVAAVVLGALAGCGGGTSQSAITNPVPSQSKPVSTGSPSPVPTISALYPSCAPAGEQLVDGVDTNLSVFGPNAFAAGSVVRWNGSDRPTTNNGMNGLTAQISATDIAAAGTAVVTVFNPAPGAGSSNSLTFTITRGAVDPQAIAVDATGKFAYVMNGGCTGGVGGYVSMYTINPTTGALASIGPPVFTGGFGLYPGALALDPLGKFAYAVNEGDPWGYEDGAAGGVAMYTIDATTGVLTYTGSINGTGDIDGSCPGLCNPGSMVVDPSGKFAYVTTGAAGLFYGIAMYTIDPTTGTLTSIGKVAASAAAIPSSVAADPAGKFVYAPTTNGTASSPGEVSMYAINATGALASTGTIAAGTDPGVVAVDPSGKFAYVTNASSNNVSMYTIDGATGALTSVGTIATGTNPDAVAVDPSGKFVYVTNYSSNNVSMYTINATSGALTSIGTTPAQSNPSSIAIHPSGKFAYATNSGSNEVSTYSIGATGTLTLIGTTGT